MEKYKSVKAILWFGLMFWIGLEGRRTRWADRHRLRSDSSRRGGMTVTTRMLLAMTAAAAVVLSGCSDTSVRHSVQTSEERIEALESNLEDLTAIVETLDERIDDLERELETVSTKADETCESLDDLRDQLNEFVRDLRSDIQASLALLFVEFDKPLFSSC
jgi:outer membrane murein-binding lipoprotein Lpp